MIRLQLNITDMIKLILKCLLAIIIALPLITACTDDDDEIENESFSSTDFRVLKISEGDERLEDGQSGVSAFDLSLEIVFSHPLNRDAIASNLGISGDPQYEVSYDDSTNTIATLEFELLEYQTEYVVNLPAGSYGEAGQSSNEDFSFSFTTRPFVIPEVTLSSENLNPEEGGSTTITATLSETTTDAVEVNLSFAGDATLGDDYTASSSTITIPLGEESGFITLEISDDIIPEGAETIEVGIESLVNGTEETPQVVNIEILDNDVFTDLELKGVMAIRWSSEPSGNSGKAVHLRATADIADLSVYSIGVANNGGGSDGIEYTFPSIAVAAGEDVLLAREPDALLDYFSDSPSSEFEHVFQSDEMNQNGDDAVELFSGAAVIQTYGDVIPDGTGEPWEYTGSWGYYFGDYWYYGGIDCAAGSTTTQDSDCTYPLYAPVLQLQGLMSFEIETRDRAIHLRANRDIADLSVYGIEIVNNGGVSDGAPEFLMAPISVSEGDQILFLRGSDAATITTYLGNCFNAFDHVFEDSGSDINFNGDDPVLLYENNTVLEFYGTFNESLGEYEDGTGLFWEYDGSWAFKQTGDVFITGGVGCTAPGTTNATSSCPYPFCE